MIKEALIVLLQWVDPTVTVQPVQACVPMESPEQVERTDERMKKNMGDLGKPQPGVIVDPWSVLSDDQRRAYERGESRAGGN